MDGSVDGLGDIVGVNEGYCDGLALGSMDSVGLGDAVGLADGILDGYSVGA